ncbi:MAG: hypothetical protein EOO77_38630 [Oxalobacteraceae bacterium]|nr:MAG: hypothetical protein EOO77_38630 [Oxalobacteraceae bacterium]
MRDLINLITEAFDSAISFEWTTRTDQKWEADALLGGRTYTLDLTAITDWDEEKQEQTTEGWSCCLSGPIKADTQTALAIWGGVMHCLREFISAVEPTSIAFQGVTPSRVKLYATLLRRNAAEIDGGGYTVEQDAASFRLVRRDDQMSFDFMTECRW